MAPLKGQEIAIQNIQANLLIDVKGEKGDQSPFFLFDGDADGKVDKKGASSAKTDVIKKAGAGAVQFPDRLTLLLKGSIIQVQAKAHVPLLPDKVIGEGKGQVVGSGQVTVQLTDPKSGQAAGEVSFTVEYTGQTGPAGGSTAGAVDGAGVSGSGPVAGGTGVSGSAPGRQSAGGHHVTDAIKGGSAATGVDTQASDQGYAAGASQGAATGGSVAGVGTANDDDDQGGYGYQAGSSQGLGTGARTKANDNVSGALTSAGPGGVQGQQQGVNSSGVMGAETAGRGEHTERHTHNVKDHEENESHETSTKRL